MLRAPLRLLTAVDAAEKALNAARTKGFSTKADFFFVDENPGTTTLSSLPADVSAAFAARLADRAKTNAG